MKSILKAKNMLTLPRLAIYLIAWFLLVFLTVLISAEGLFIKIDEFVYRQAFTATETSTFEDKIILIDLPRQDLSLEDYRGETAKFLRTIDSMVISQKAERNVNSTSVQNQKKPTVILDLNYGASPLGVPELRAAINQLKLNDINVYGAYTTPAETDAILFDTFDNNKNKVLYDSVFVGGRLHPTYNINRSGCIISYPSFVDIPRDTIGNSIRIESLIVRVAKDYLGIREVDFYELKTQAVPIDSINERYNKKTYHFTDKLGSITSNFPEFNKSHDLSGAFIIVGRFSVDKKVLCDNSIPGPFLLASGLVNELQPANDSNDLKKAHSDIPVQLFMAFLFALLVCVFYALLFKYAKGLQTKPLVIGIISFIGGILILIILGYAFLRIDFIIRPALPAVSMFWASFLAWRFANKFLVTGIVEGSGKYDVFISYSFGDSTWVKQNLYNPLKDLKKSDGSKLEIFFAEKSIELGELFVSKYMKAIVNSKMFIPVMSKEYYNKNHCKNEMDLAVKRKIEELLNICILAFDYNYVPDEFTNMLLIDVNNQKNFITDIHSNILAQDSEQTEITVSPEENNNRTEKEVNVEVVENKDLEIKTKDHPDKKQKSKKSKSKKNSDTKKKKKVKLKSKKKPKKEEKPEKKDPKKKNKTKKNSKLKVQEKEIEKTIKKLQKLMKEIKQQKSKGK